MNTELIVVSVFLYKYVSISDICNERCNERSYRCGISMLYVAAWPVMYDRPQAARVTAPRWKPCSAHCCRQALERRSQPRMRLPARSMWAFTSAATVRERHASTARAHCRCLPEVCQTESVPQWLSAGCPRCLAVWLSVWLSGRLSGRLAGLPACLDLVRRLHLEATDSEPRHACKLQGARRAGT
jgi:hypothetical protein